MEPLDYCKISICGNKQSIIDWGSIRSLLTRY